MGGKFGRVEHVERVDGVAREGIDGGGDNGFGSVEGGESGESEEVGDNVELTIVRRSNLYEPKFTRSATGCLVIFM